EALKGAAMFDPEKVDRWLENNQDLPTMIRAEVVLASDYDTLLKLYREYRDEAIRNAQGARNSQKEPEYAWECNECGSAEYSMSISEDDLENLACGRCGANEFHKVAERP